MALVGQRNIRTNDGRFLSLVNPNDAIAFVDVALGENQVWDFQLIGGNTYTIQNVGQNVYAQSPLAANAQVTGGVAAMNWTFVANGDRFIIRPAANNDFRWNVVEGGVRLLQAGAADGVAVGNAQRFNINNNP